MHRQRKKPHEELSKTKPKFHETTYAEETEEFSLLADVFAPPFNKRVPGNDARLGKRVHLTPADKKKVNKASISLPVPRTLKLHTYNTRPFILEHTISLEEFREKYSAYQLFNIIVEARRSNFHSAPAVRPRTSLGGFTLCSIIDQQTSAAPQNLAAVPSEDLHNRETPDNTALPVTLDTRLNKVKPELLVKVHTWLEHVNAPIVAEPESSNLVSESVIDQGNWELIERSCRQRKSRLRQMPSTMSTETNNISIRGSNNTRPSGSYLRPAESNTHTTTNAIQDRPGTTARQPKNMPSGSQLPSCWNDEMDEFICHMEAQCEFSTRSIVRALKQRFAVLKEVSASFFIFELWWHMLTLQLACHPGRGYPASHRHS